MKFIHHSYRNICFAFFHIISEVQILTLQMQKSFWSSSHLHKITRNNRYFIFIILFSYIDFVLNGFSRIQHQNWYFFGVCSYIRQKKLHKLFVLKSTILNPKWISSFRSEIQFKSINLINIFLCETERNGQKSLIVMMLSSAPESHFLIVLSVTWPLLL